ncbi:MAG: hypothetical protein MUF71_15750 [Candidatus Kapabacteria bacterium]|jgi:hypothetical protein|nr:hypothetical protein [Candidatus Kapabacteria bacterium]
MNTNDLNLRFDLAPKQKELIQDLFGKVQERYPEISFLRLGTSPEDREHIWIYVSAPMPEEREIELSRFASELEADILTDYGYMFSVMTKNPTLQPA